MRQGRRREAGAPCRRPAQHSMTRPRPSLHACYCPPAGMIPPRSARSPHSVLSPPTSFREVVAVYPLKLVAGEWRDTNVVVNHELREGRPVDEDDLGIDVACKILCIAAK